MAAGVGLSFCFQSRRDQGSRPLIRGLPGAPFSGKQRRRGSLPLQAPATQASRPPRLHLSTSRSSARSVAPAASNRLCAQPPREPPGAGVTRKRSARAREAEGEGEEQSLFYMRVRAVNGVSVAWETGAGFGAIRKRPRIFKANYTGGESFAGERSQGQRSLQLDPGKEVVTSRRAGTLGVLPGNHGELRAHRPVSPQQLGNSGVMAYHHLLKKDIVTLCRKRGLSIGKFTKAQLIVQLEEDDRSKEQIPYPKWGYSRIWEQLEWEPGIAKTPVPYQTGVFMTGFPIGGIGDGRTGLELSPREHED
ncbi:hypothetical protein UY3_17216 [Chelonia mydas]|uniref:Uncharacterized protein n=1 Tax=Chelonia mydas TaxID=8469 RepID=M7B0W3_CHEMY|nr:hypothetical protein UY3_17216 [Chelonia mydas]